MITALGADAGAGAPKLFAFPPDRSYLSLHVAEHPYALVPHLGLGGRSHCSDALADLAG